VSPRKIVFISLIAVSMLASCGMDPLSNRPIPTVGMVYTSTASGVADVLIPDGFDPDSGMTEDSGLELVEPERGTPAGGEIVFIHGWGFEKGCDVYFDGSEGRDVFYVNSKKLRVETPSHGLGFVDIAVRWPTGKVRILPQGFLYETNLEVTSVEPAVGPIGGGTPVTVMGSGFMPGTKLLVDGRLALHIEVVDDTTIYAVTPPGSSGGPVDVHVSNLAGVRHQEDAFTYSVLPQLISIVPAAGPVAGGQEVVVTGKWLAPVTNIYFGDIEAVIVNTANNQLVVQVPPGVPGTVDVVAVGTWGWDELESAYLYVPAVSTGSSIAAIVPAKGPEQGGTAVTVVGCDLVVEGGPTSVRFGSANAAIELVLEEECAVVVISPPGLGVVEIEASGPWGTFTSSPGFTYEAALTVTDITPNSGPAEGGSRVSIFGTWFSPDVQVMFGPLAAGDVKYISNEELEAVAPPGSPGLVDVTVISATSFGTRKNGFLYTVAKPEVWVITPDYGSRAGGTHIEIFGAGFTLGTEVTIGAQETFDTNVKSYGRIRAYTPPNSVGTYDLTVHIGNLQASLPDAYSYFDPTSWYGGTWGPPIDGAVNVTVFDASQWAPLEGATVVLGANPNTVYQKVTDSNGHATLSGPDLVGPLDIHVTKKDHDAASIVHMDAENGTLYLIPMNPPSTGPVEPIEPLPPGGLDGRVIGMGKYVVVPRGDCKKKVPSEDGLCAPCMNDSDCLGDTSCLALGKSGKFCTRTCLEAEADEDDGGSSSCPVDYMCAPVDSLGTHCVPAMGVKTARCELSSTSIYNSSYGADPFVSVDEEFRYTLNDTRLGEVAVICLGGWQDLDTNEFHPLAMGVKRHVNIAPGEFILDQNIWLNIPLSRQVRLRMDEPPAFKQEYGGFYRVNVFLDFGSDGIYRLPGEFEGLAPEDVMLESLPASLIGDIYDASYILYAGAYTNTYDQTPYSVLYLDELSDFEESSVAALVGTEFVPMPEAPAREDLKATWTSPDGTIVVGGKGHVFKYTNSSFYQLPSVVDETLHDLYGFPNGLLYAVGDAGVVVQYNGLQWSLLGSATDKPLYGVWGSDPDDVHAVGDHRLVSYYEGTWHVQKIGANLRDISGNSPDNIWAVGLDGVIMKSDGLTWSTVASPTMKNLYAVHVYADSRVLIAGDSVAFLFSDGEWTSLDLDPSFTARRIRLDPLVEDGFYLTGAPKKVAHYLPQTGFTMLTAPANLLVNDLFFTPAGETISVGTPALLLTPFVPFPEFKSPLDEKAMDQLLLHWTYDGNASVINVHTISITQKTGRTLWRFTVDGSETWIPLPNFPLMIGVEPLPPGEKRLRIYSAHAPDFSINSFDLSSLGTLSWTSWAYDMISMDLQEENP
jgi:hypothetical protein